MKTPRERKLEKALKLIAANLIRSTSTSTNHLLFIIEMALKPEPKHRKISKAANAAYKKYHPRA